jgi:hypothetical protein
MGRGRVLLIRQTCLAAIVLLLAGCSGSSQLKGKWKADDYFTDPQVIALCHAIEANDLDEIDRLVAAGANVNALGKGNMTPLLCAFPDNKLARFRRLLEHGANPNVVVESDFGTIGNSRMNMTEA